MPTKRLYPPTRLHDAVTQETTSVKTSDVTGLKVIQVVKCKVRFTTHVERLWVENGSRKLGKDVPCLVDPDWLLLVTSSNYENQETDNLC